MTNYLVTGAAGFIGSSITKRLLDENNTVYTIDNLSTGTKKNIPKGTIFIKGDCSDQEIYKNIKNIKFDAIFHIAGQSSGEVSFEDPIYDIKTNLESTILLLKFSLANGCKKFIGISSGAAIKNYDGWLNYCVTKSAFRSMFLQYQKDLPKLNFKLISPGILSTRMNEKIKDLDVSIYPDMKKFHLSPAVDPQKASKLIYQKYDGFFRTDTLEIDLRNEDEW